jgi:hypothetical protein
MRPLHQLIGALLLVAVTAASIYRIAEARNERAAGAGVFRLDESRGDEMEAFGRLRNALAAMGQGDLAERLEALRAKGSFWVAPNLGPGRWAVFVNSASLVRRIYVRRLALLEPRAHLYAADDPVTPAREQEAFAWISLGGALYHELCHYEGVVDEGAAYDREIAWYEALRTSPWHAGLDADRRRVYDWALESAVLSARKARSLAVP